MPLIPKKKKEQRQQQSEEGQTVTGRGRAFDLVTVRFGPFGFGRFVAYNGSICDPYEDAGKAPLQPRHTGKRRLNG